MRTDNFYIFNIQKKRVQGIQVTEVQKVLKHRFLSKDIENKPPAKAHDSKPKEFYI